MVVAARAFNSAGLSFRADLLIFTSIIAWTYLPHGWFKREGVDLHKERQRPGGRRSPGSDIAETLKIARKEVEKRKYLLAEIVKIIHQRFTMDNPTPCGSG
jgi:hypothetical protein